MSNEMRAHRFSGAAAGLEIDQTLLQRKVIDIAVKDYRAEFGTLEANVKWIKPVTGAYLNLIRYHFGEGTWITCENLASGDGVAVMVYPDWKHKGVEKIGEIHLYTEVL